MYYLFIYSTKICIANGTHQNGYRSADNVACLLFRVGAVGVMSLRNCKDCVVNGQLTTLAGIRTLLLLLLLLTAVIERLLLLLLLLLLLSDATTVWAVGRGWISETARTADTAATVIASTRWSATLPGTFRHSTVTNRCNNNKSNKKKNCINCMHRRCHTFTRHYARDFPVCFFFLINSKLKCSYYSTRTQFRNVIVDNMKKKLPLNCPLWIGAWIHIYIYIFKMIIYSFWFLQSRDMPTARHFLKRQYWQRLRLSRMTRHLPSRRHRYSICFWILRRKNPFK